MFHKIIHTLGTRFLSAIVNLLIVVITSRFLGAEGKGWYSWWILNITFTMLISNFVGGSALVYFASRFKITSLLKHAYAWGILSGISVSYFLLKFSSLDAQHFTHFLVLSILETFISIHLFIFQGKNKIKWMNWHQFLSLLFFLISFALFCLGKLASIQSVIYSFYIAKILVLVLSTLFLNKLISHETQKQSIEIKRLIQFGITLQIANIAQFLNYRFTFYVLEYTDPTLFTLGVFSTAISIAEGIWIFSKSISAVHYAEVSNSKNISSSIQSTLMLVRLTVVVVCISIISLLMVPKSFYPLLLGNDFHEIKTILYFLLPGVFVFSISGIVSHFFSGIGINKYAMQSALISLCITIFLSFMLIPIHNSIGAAIATSVSYLISVIYLCRVFVRLYKLSFSAFIPSRKDFIFFINKLKNNNLRTFDSE